MLALAAWFKYLVRSLSACALKTLSMNLACYFFYRWDTWPSLLRSERTVCLRQILQAEVNFPQC